MYPLSLTCLFYTLVTQELEQCVNCHTANFSSVLEYCRAYVATIIRRGIGLTTGFIGSHTVTHNYSVYTSQLTIAAATLL
jgi:hypothetical protein